MRSAPGLNTLRVNQFGGSLGGPIRRDKAFHFVGYEGQRRAASPTFSTFILGCLDDPGCMGPGTPSINQVKEQFGLQPEQLNSILQIDNYDKAMGKSRRSSTKETSLTSAISSATIARSMRRRRLLAKSCHRPTAIIPYRIRPSTETTCTFLGRAGHRRVSSTTATASFTSLPRARASSRHSMFRTRSSPEVSRAAFLITGSRASRHSRTFNYVRGAHSFKFGGGFEPVWIAADTTFFSPGAAIFTPQSFFGAGEFAGPPFGPGTPVQFLFLQPRSYFGQQIPACPLPFAGSLYAGSAVPAFVNATSLKLWHRLVNFYGQDQWKATPNLSLTLGLRYDLDIFPPLPTCALSGK
jgi:outer membrane receptor protein involved in Fe transport